MAISGLVFDFDGLILDTEVPEFEAWQHLFRDHGCELELSVWQQCIGTSADAFDPYDYLEQQLGRPVDRTELREKHRAHFLKTVEANKALPGILEYLTEAADLGLLVGLASSSTRDWVTGHLARLGLLGYFDCIRTRDECPLVKPHPDLYRSVLENWGLAASEAVAFEDSLNGLKAAKAAGMLCVVVPNRVTNDMPLGLADLRLNSLSDLTLKELLVRLAKPRAK